MSREFSVNFNDFNRKFFNIVKNAIPGDAADGLREAGQEWKIDADTVPPKTPHLEGGLRGSGKVSKAEIKGKSINVKVSYDTPYAKKWHEAEPGTINWSETGVGPKYLESKAVMFMKKYMAIVSEVIRRRAR